MLEAFSGHQIIPSLDNDKVGGRDMQDLNGSGDEKEPWL
jgi:hypothetical protein